MRVISGTAKGRKLKEPSDQKIRPTTDKVKESVFNIIQFDLEGRRVLDLFAGTGQMGIEALSRGAGAVTFVDASPKAIQLVKENLKTTGLASDARVVQGDALAFLRPGEKYDIIFLDPPYESTLLADVLQKIVVFDILKENGIIVCESSVEHCFSVLPAPYRLYREYPYGKIKLTLFTRASASGGEAIPI